MLTGEAFAWYPSCFITFLHFKILIILFTKHLPELIYIIPSLITFYRTAVDGIFPTSVSDSTTKPSKIAVSRHSNASLPPGHVDSCPARWGHVSITHQMFGHVIAREHYLYSTFTVNLSVHSNRTFELILSPSIMSSPCLEFNLLRNMSPSHDVPFSFVVNNKRNRHDTAT